MIETEILKSMGEQIVDQRGATEELTHKRSHTWHFYEQHSNLSTAMHRRIHR